MKAKKKAAKKIVKRAVSKKIVKPLEEWNGYNINRTVDTVSFGCGEVEVSKQDIRELAKVKINKKFVDLIDRNEYLFTDINALSNEDRKTLVELFSTKDKGLKAFSNIAMAAIDNETAEFISKISSKDLLAIAGN